MRLGFDGKRLTHNRTGLGNYSRFILKILTKYHPENDYNIYSVKESKSLISDLDAARFHVHYPKPSSIKSLWRSWGVVRDLNRDKIKLYHGLSNELPLGLKNSAITSVVTIHDLIFLRFPSYFPFIDRQIYRWKSKYAVRNADCIIAISEQTKRDIVQYFNVPAEKIQVIYQNCSRLFRTVIEVKERKALSAKYNLPDRYLLHVGTIEERKNLLLIAKALPHIESGISLVVIGKQTPYVKTIEDFLSKNKLENRVIFLKDVPTEDLPGIYQQCEIFIYPSKFEGFGIPVVEALYSSVPVIAAYGSSLEEAGGAFSMYVGTDDPEELAGKVKSILGNSVLKQEMINEGLKHVEKFDEKKLADQLVELYKNLIENAE